jgi:crotonobetainyl-CoA:carnitine CoA-transferase CaiB-like acyl-CoA transferase
VTSPGPLAGMHVVDFSRLFAGPYATMMLADLGADVIKIESPSGDEARQFGPPFIAGEGMNFMALNRHKRSAILNLKRPGAVAVARMLTATADVVVENFRPGVADKLGIGFDEVHAANPRLVYCSISGFGRDGGYQDRPALDIILQGMTGVMDRQGQGGPPRLMVVTVADTYAASLAVQGVLAALLARERDGKGQHVEVTLLDALIAAQGYRIISPADEVMLPAVDDTCPYQAFQAADGAWLVIAVVSPNTWEALCAAIGRPNLASRPEFAANPDRVAHRKTLIPLLEASFKACPRDEWLDRLRAAGVPCGPVRKVEELLEDPHVLSRGTIVKVDHPSAGPLRTMGTALHLSRTPTVTGGPAPRVGEHTGQILAELGYDGAAIADLAGDGAIPYTP